MSDLVGQLIADRFRVESLIGTGGSGSVYRAVQEQLGRPVALKMLKPELSENPAVRNRFVREARAVATLSHPNIATIYDFGSDETGALYIALEFIEGLSLADLLTREVMSFPELRDIFDQILAGLAHAHSRGVIHRDIKPANILVTPSAEGGWLTKIVDFGIAVGGSNWTGDSDTTGTGRVVGTPHFMAPEQARGERHLTATVDVYNVGLMLYWAISGVHAFDGKTPMDVMIAQVSAPIPDLKPLPGLSIPEGLPALIRDALQKSPLLRIPSATAFRSRLRAVGGLVPGLTRPTERAPGRSAVAPPTMVEGASPTMREDALLDQPFEDRDPTTSHNLPLITARSLHGLIGRENDRRRLIEAADRAINTGRAAVLTIEGEAGMGKTTMAHWLRDELQNTTDVRYAFGAFHREGERGFRGLREVYDMLLDTRGLESSRLYTQVTRLLDEWGMTDPRDSSKLVSFLRPSTKWQQPEAQEGAQQSEALFELLLRILERVAHETPLMVVLDDFHWAGPETCGFVEFLVSEFAHRRLPLVLLATVQSEDTEGQPVETLLARISRFEGETVSRIRLDKLDPDDARSLIHALIDADADLCDALIARTGGNPMHLVQLVRYLTEEGLLESSSSGLRPRDGVDVNDVMPPGLADMIRLRIEQVSRNAQRGDRIHHLLDRIAVLGRSFRFSVLERMLQIENRTDLLESIDEDIDELLNLELLHMTEGRDDDIIHFPTSLIRDVIMDGLRNRRTTRKLHLFAAEAKLAVLGKDADKVAAELTQHFAAARDRVRELLYARTAADVAQRGHRPADALSFLLRSLELLEENEAEMSADEALELRLRAAGLCVGFGRYAEAQEHFSAVLDGKVAASAEARVRALNGLAGISFVMGDFDAARVQYQQSVDLAGEVKTLGPIVDAHLGAGRICVHRGEFDEAEAHTNRALDLLQDSPDPMRHAECMWHRGEIARARGDVTQARMLYEAAQIEFQGLDHPLGIAKCYAMLAVVGRMTDDLAVAERNYQAALDIYRRHGARRGMAHQLNGLGDVARFRGDFRLATENYRRAVDIFQALQLPFDAAIALTNLALVARESGSTDEAEEALRNALRVAERVGYAYLTLGVKLNLAHVLALNGAHEEAEVQLAESLGLADKVEMVDPDYARPLEALADLLASSGRLEQASELYERAREMWEELGRPEDIARIASRMKTD
jgi:serine/threonine protein kinase/tetratricopeptide (TPR) repeat protein